MIMVFNKLKLSGLVVLLLCSLSQASTFAISKQEIDEQLAKDPTIVPVTKSAIFVPALSKDGTEPYFQVYQNGAEVTKAPTGSRAIVSPGTYTVFIGSGVLDQRYQTEVTVPEGKTSIIEPVWSALMVRVIDDRNQTFRGSYEIFRMTDKANVGLGIGASEELGEKQRVWLLMPGFYKITKSSQNYLTLNNFSTIRILPGELINFTLVMDRTTQNFVGAGVVPEYSQQRALGNWKIAMNLGGDIQFSVSKNVVGKDNNFNTNLNGILSTTIRYRKEKSEVFSKIQIFEGLTYFQNASPRKTLDKFDFNASYIYWSYPWVGPIAWIDAEGNFLPQYAYFTEKRDVRVLDSNGAFSRSLSGVERVKTANSFSPLILEEGLGAQFQLFGYADLGTQLRTGYSWRQTISPFLLRPQDDASTPELEYQEVSRTFRDGALLNLLTSLSLVRNLLIITEFDVFFPRSDWSNLTMGWNNTLSLRISAYASLDYDFDMIYDTTLSNDLQIDQRLLLRFFAQIF